MRGNLSKKKKKKKILGNSIKDFRVMKLLTQSQVKSFKLSAPFTWNFFFFQREQKRGKEENFILAILGKLLSFHYIFAVHIGKEKNSKTISSMKGIFRNCARKSFHFCMFSISNKKFSSFRHLMRRIFEIFCN